MTKRVLLIEDDEAIRTNVLEMLEAEDLQGEGAADGRAGLEAFMAEVVRLGVADKAAFLPTVCLIRGPRAMRFMRDHVPGIDVPDQAIRQVETATDQKEAAYQFVLEQARHALSLPGVRGIHIADFRHDESVGRLVTDLGVIPRHEEHDAHDPAVAV